METKVIITPLLWGGLLCFPTKKFHDRLINSLPEQQRKCFLLSREENLSYKEIAERLGISQKTVEIHMGKALKFLKDKVKRGWEILLSLLSF